MAALVLTTIGSWGDLFPFVGLGRELQRRGHDIRIAASPAWESIVVEAGLRFAPVGRRIGFEEFARHPEIFRRVPFGLRAALRRFLFDQIDLVTDDLRPRRSRAPTWSSPILRSWRRRAWRRRSQGCR